MGTRLYDIISATMNPAADALQPTFPSYSPLENSLGDEHLFLLNALRELAASFALPVYLVGGPVRDWLLGLPVRDLDFVVESDAPSLARVLAGKTGGRVIVHDRFGTATVVRNGTRIDLVTARSEVYPVPGALPAVEASTLKDDLARRDFTINAMALPLGGGVEALQDPFRGQSDLRHGLIRTIHSRSFTDDPTRLFRAVRYEQRLEFELEAGTHEQLLAGVEERRCDSISGDRVRHEVEKMLEEEHPERALSRAAELGLFSTLVPELAGADYVDRWATVQSSHDGTGQAGRAHWLAALAYPLSRAEGERLISRLNLRVTWANLVRGVIQLRTIEPELTETGLLPSELFRLLEGIDAEALVVAAALTDSPEVAANLGMYLDELMDLEPFLKGGDLLNLGVPPGPPVGRTLAMLKDARLDRRVNSEEEERQWVRDLVTAECGGLAHQQLSGNGDDKSTGKGG